MKGELEKMRLIDADSLDRDYFDVWTKEYGNITVVSKECVDYAPTVEAETIVYAEIEQESDDEEQFWTVCSKCRGVADHQDKRCRNCGAYFKEKSKDA